MASPLIGRLCVWLSLASLALGQGCYYAPGSKYEVPSDWKLLPCDINAPFSSCCFAGDICLTGNACFNAESGNTYQYGCTDISYQDASCPYKCGFSPDHSPWVALENCADDGVPNTWVCEAPESCGCLWYSYYGLLHLPGRSCKAMGSKARVAIYGPTDLAAYASLPGSAGGSTGYFPPTATTVVKGYTPGSGSFGPTETYTLPRSVVQLYAGSPEAPSAGTAKLPGTDGGLPPSPTTGILAESSSIPPEFLAGSTAPPNGGGATSTTSGGGAGSTSTGAGSGSGSGGGGSSGGGGGLTTGAKVGLGVGIAGGVCLIAAIILVAVVLRKRKQPAKAPSQDPDYAAGYNDKSHDSYQSYTSAPPETAAYYDPHSRATPSPGLYEAPYTPTEEQLARKRMSPQGPQELDGDTERHELESNTGTSPAIGGHSRSVSGVSEGTK